MAENDEPGHVSPGQAKPPATIFVVSGGYGLAGDQLARTVLAQFPGANVPVIIHSQVHQREQVEEILTQAEASSGLILHTMVHGELRHALAEEARKKHIPAIDLMGPLIEWLARTLGQEPLGKPGYYRMLHENYFKRIEGLEFTLAHDDGLNHKDWPRADIVLVGVSRVGKTPLSMYLAMMGWKVANVPLVLEVPPREELFQLDRRRVVGLLLDPDQLLHHREHRQRTLRMSKTDDYCNPKRLYEEIQAARRVFQRGGFESIDVTGKPIETTAFQVVAQIRRQLAEPAP